MLLIIILSIVGIIINIINMYFYSGLYDNNKIEKKLKKKRLSSFRKVILIIFFFIPYSTIVVISLFTISESLKKFWNS